MRKYPRISSDQDFAAFVADEVFLKNDNEVGARLYADRVFLKTHGFVARREGDA